MGSFDRTGRRSPGRPAVDAGASFRTRIVPQISVVMPRKAVVIQMAGESRYGEKLVVQITPIRATGTPIATVATTLPTDQTGPRSGRVRPSSSARSRSAALCLPRYQVK